MKPIFRKLWAKTLAIILLCVFVLLGAAALLGSIYSYEAGWYYSNESFVQSELCQSAAMRYAANLDSFCMAQPELGWDTELVLGEGIGAVVYGADGSVLSDTRTADMERVSDGALIKNNEGGYSIEIWCSVPVQRGDALAQAYATFNFLHGAYRSFIPLAVVSALAVLALLLFLGCAAGLREGEEGVVLHGLNVIPFDLYLALLLFIALFGVLIAQNGLYYLAGAVIYAAALVLWTLVLAAVVTTLSARFKAGKWWRNTIIFYVCRLASRAAKFLARALPLAWKTALGYIAFVLLNLMLLASCYRTGSSLGLLVLLLLDAAGFGAALALSLHLRALQKAGKALAAGDLTHTVDTSKMRWEIKAHGDDLNSISLGMSKAVDERMKSERFRTELITNVSHDLKTPLTSIVSYVDLLKNEDVQNQNALEYIEVLERQSARLKKLTEDLVEASKASSGAIAVHPEKLNVGEILTQTAGEFAERLSGAGVETVLSMPETDVVILADGRLLWRVLDNLLQNVCKYALRGTRAYLTVKMDAANAVIIVKNISAAPLNIPPEELMERFVRGDLSRGTDGSGLGLSIARSLTDLMGGSLSLQTDGDLFKATLTFAAI